MQPELTNTSYFFLPFVFQKRADFAPVIDALDCSDLWELQCDENHYMLKFVADKIDSSNKQNCQCFHYVLKETGRGNFGLGSREDWFSTAPHSYKGESESIRFQIPEVHLYCFSTSVGIMAFRLRLQRDDPFWISNAQYHLKKCAREKFRLDSEDAAVSMLELSKRLVCDIDRVSETEFFFYANPSTERANILTYLEVEAKDDYKKELYYLRRCYSEGFLYSEDVKLDAEEIYAPARDMAWGISPEAAACLVCPEMGRGDFFHNTFVKNFNAQYLFMYVLLLHQKYVLYMFLTKIGVGMYNDLETLEEYRHQLYEFETDFVFSCVTEVPQYQVLYERMTEAFSLRQMYKDVHEPLISLGEVRRAAEENEKERREKNVNNALLLLSLLSFFSALVDSYDFIDSFGHWFTEGSGIRVAQGICIFAIFLIGFLVLKELFRNRKKKEKKGKKKNKKR